jgi:hypothetical protein
VLHSRQTTTSAALLLFLHTHQAEYSFERTPPPLLQARTADGNTKVAAATLECLVDVIRVVGDRAVTGLNTLVPALAAALGSSNDKVRGGPLRRGRPLQCASAAPEG